MKYWPFALQTFIIPIRSARIATLVSVSIFLVGGYARAQQPVSGADTATIVRSPMTAVRSSHAAAPTELLYFITDAGSEGLCRSDPLDRGTADDSAMPLVT